MFEVALKLSVDSLHSMIKEKVKSCSVREIGA
jgi:hypothetical protein